MAKARKFIRKLICLRDKAWKLLWRSSKVSSMKHQPSSNNEKLSVTKERTCTSVLANNILVHVLLNVTYTEKPQLKQTAQMSQTQTKIEWNEYLKYTYLEVFNMEKYFQFWRKHQKNEPYDYQTIYPEKVPSNTVQLWRKKVILLLHRLYQIPMF